MTNRDPIIVYTDGSSLGNPGPGGWGAVILYPDKQVEELGGRNLHTTNNKMELTAPIEALKKISKRKEPIFIYTDSSYVINGITKWVKGWQKKGWKTIAKKEVLNKELWEKLLKLSSKHRISWHHVRAHQGVPANERVDLIATSFASHNKISLYKGLIGKYHINNFSSIPLTPRPARKNSKNKTLFYLSLIDGVIMRHKTWTECEKRVKGVSGAKYNKVTTNKDEANILKSWKMSVF